MAAKHSCKGRVKAGGLFCGAMLDRRTIAEIQTLRVKLQHFGSEQQDPAVQFYCLAVEFKPCASVARSGRSNAPRSPDKFAGTT